MNIKIIYLITVCFAAIGCSEQVDFSNPKSVINQFFKLKGGGKIELEYELIADTCKEYATLQDYLNQYITRDSILNTNNFSIKAIEQLPIDPLLPKYRLFEIQYLLIEKSTKDTSEYISYETIYNEKGEWKVIWTKNLEESAFKLINSQKIEEGMQVYREILKYDPLNGNAFLQLGWALYRQGYYESALVDTKKAIELNPKNEENYNLLANIYSSQNNGELAIENYKRAVEMTLTENQKVYLLSNMSTTYIDLLEYDEARKVLSLAMSIDSNFTHAWWHIGILYEKENNLDSAIICYKKAAELEPMDNFLQQQLFFSLSNAQYTKARTKEPIKGYRHNLLTDAKKHILMALDIQPENSQYRNLLDDINRIK
jgi:tetratricopeptide (TPR) repeat protein